MKLKINASTEISRTAKISRIPDRTERKCNVALIEKKSYFKGIRKEKDEMRRIMLRS